MISEKEFQNLYTFLQLHSSKIVNLTMIQTMKKFPTNNFISHSLFKKTQVYSNCIEFQFNIVNHHQCKIHCTLYFYSKDFKTLNQNLIKALLQSVSFILSFCNQPKKFIIHYVPLPDKKLISKRQKSFTKHMINSGCSSGCSSHTGKETIIYVWRIEECIKVIFHECIHSFTSQDHIEDHKLVSIYKKRYNLKSTTIDFEESYVELWAKIINCYYKSQISHSSNSFESFCSLITTEKEYCIHQAYKILSYQRERNIDLDKYTNVTSYYLITAELFTNIKNFLSFCKKFNYLYLNDKYLFCQFLHHSKKISRNKSKNKDNSLRMTI